MQATTKNSATVSLSPIVNYHGTLTRYHGLWRVIDNYGAKLKLRDAWGNKIYCRPGSITLVDIPRFTEARADALANLRQSHIGRIPAGRVRTWLVDNGFIEADAERPGRYQLTPLGLIVDEAITPFYYGGTPVELPA